MENSKTTMQQDYPTRPQARNCLFFVITGKCRFGQLCRFNHPVDDAVEVNNQEEVIQNVYLKSTRNIPCKFYNAGFCKYGPYCRFYHSPPVPVRVPNPSPQFNSLGLPMRVGIQACSYYLSFGKCGYGARCKFHHPELMEVGTQEYDAYACAEAEYPYGSTTGGFTPYFYHDE